MSQTRRGLQHLGGELSCLANKRGSLTKIKRKCRHSCAVLCQCQLSNMLLARFPASFALLFPAPPPPPGLVTNRAQAAALASFSLSQGLDGVSLLASQFSASPFHLCISNAHVLRVPLIPLFRAIMWWLISLGHCDLSPQFPLVSLTHLVSLCGSNV